LSSPDDAPLLMTPVAAEGIKPSNTMGVARRQTTGQVFLTNQIVSLVGLDPSEQQDPLMGTPTARMGKGASAPGTEPFEKQLGRGKIEAQVLILPTPRASEGMRNPLRPHAKDTSRLEDAVAVNLLPTPQAHDAAKGKTAEQVAAMRAKGHGVANLNELAENELVQLMPTPRATDGSKGGPNQRGSKGDLMLPSAVTQLLPTPVAQPSGNTPEEHLRKKPGRKVVTDLAILTENGLLETGGKLLQTPSVADGLGGHERRGGKRGSELLLNGQAKEIAKQQQEPPLLRTPCAQEAGGGPLSPAMATARNQTLRLTGQIIDLVNPGQLQQPGENTSRPSAAGSKPSDAQPRHQPSLLDAMEDSD
jgi:hypothetical protein